MLAKIDTNINTVKTGSRNKEQKIPIFTDNDLWDKQMEDTESSQIKKLLEMAEQAKKDYRNGKCESGGFGY